VRNTGDNAAYAAEKFVRDYGDKLSDEVKKDTEEKAQSLREALAESDLDRIRRETEALLQHIQGLGAQMYDAGAAEAEAPPEGGPDTSADDDVVEGEVVEP
jgi:molecular chaperone DnaK